MSEGVANDEGSVPIGRIEPRKVFACPCCSEVLEEVDFASLVRDGSCRCPRCFLILKLADSVASQIRAEVPTAEAQLQTLECPACGGVLRPLPSRPVRIPLDRCERCFGIWFDRDELQQALQDQVALSRLRIDDPQTGAPAGKTRRGCPRCSGALVERRLQSVMVDECPGCEGVWLDAGEITALSELKPRKGVEPADGLEPAGVWNSILSRLADLLKR